MLKRSPLAPKETPQLPPIAGICMAACAAGIRYQGRKDLMLALLPEGTRVAGVFTRSKTSSAPVDWCRKALPGGRARALVVNSGNANAFTGSSGREAVEETVQFTAEAAGCAAEEVFLASTGVIGEALDAGVFTHLLGDLAQKAVESGWDEAAGAIMTTDTYPKLATRRARINGKTVTINGFAKGSGMIAPDMATMLAFVFTDAGLPGDVLQESLRAGVDRSFNAISVDSDTSTSDTVLLFATGTQDLGGDDGTQEQFRAVLDDLLLDLAHQVVRDGEGASKFVEIRVSGAQSDRSARRVGMSIANSPLVKTAIAGEDPNWGRIVMAVGKAGEPADRDLLNIWIGGQRVTRNGEADPEYSEDAAAQHMKGSDISITVDLGIGEGTDTVWTCDLTHAYIDINADYRS